MRKRKAPGLSCEERNTLRGISNNAKKKSRARWNEKEEETVKCKKR
jgi:hypothetical protein